MTGALGENIYSEGNISVTKTLVKVGKTSYPINGIGSVYVYKPNFIVFYIIAGVCIVIAYDVREENPDFVPVFVAISFICIVASFFRKSSLKIRTSSGDQQLLKSRNSKLLESIKSAIEKAVALRG